MKKKFKIRKYKKGDEVELVKLHREIFNSNMTLDYWKWKYEQNPHGFNILVAVDTKTGEIVGQYCHQNQKLIRDGRKFPVHYIFDMFLIKEYRGNKFHRKCAKICGDDNPRNFSINFPSSYTKNDALRSGLNRLDKFCYVYSKKIGSFLDKPPGEISVFSVKNKLNPRLKKDLDSLWKKKSKEIRIGVIRDWSFVNWRILESPNNLGLFILKDGEEIIGWFSLSIRGNTGFIVDILILNSKLNNLVTYSMEKVCKDHKCKKIALLTSDNSIQDMLFNNNYKIVGKYDSFVNGLNNNNLYLTFADMDEF